MPSRVFNAEQRAFFSIWRVNVRKQTRSKEPVPDGWWPLGGRSLLARILIDEVPGTCDPLGPQNKLIFAPGLLVGHMLSSCDRISLGAKSPLTGGVKESNAGGRTGLQLSYLGVKALIIEDWHVLSAAKDQPGGDGWWVLHLSADGARFEPAGDLAGLGVYAAAPPLLDHGASFGCQTSHACMAGCTIQSSNVYVTIDGETKVSPLEYETIGLMGPNLDIDDLDTIARLNYVTNDLGLDTIEVGAALGVAAEAGLLAFGDGKRALELLAEIRQGTPLGRTLGHGAAAAGKAFGVEWVPAVKGQAMSAYDPRSLKGTGVTYATSPQGADHTCGLTIRAQVDHLDPKPQAEVSRGAQIKSVAWDVLGACMFASFGFVSAPAVIPALLNARYGWQVNEGALEALGRESLKLEREFNRLAGFTAADDRLPEWLTREPLPPTNAVFDVAEEDLDSVFNW